MPIRAAPIAALACAALLPAQAPAGIVALASELRGRKPVVQLQRIEQIAREWDPARLPALVVLARLGVLAQPARRAALGVVAERGGADACELLLPLLRDPHCAAAAVHALGRLGEQRAFEPLRDGWRAFADDARDEVPAALVRIDPARAAPLLVEAARRGPRDELFELENALSACPPARDGVIRLLERGDAECARMAVRVLGAIGDDAAVGAMIRAWDRDASLRPALAHAFGRLRARKCANLLLHAVSSEPEEDTRAAAAGALRRIAEARIVAAAAALLAAEAAPRVQVELIALLGEQGDESVYPLLVALLDSREESAQPRQQSSIRSFPWNVRVCEAAALAILRIRDRIRTPFETLARMPPQPLAKSWPGRTIPELRRWWAGR
jgi:HEAT repeat protein